MLVRQTRVASLQNLFAMLAISGALAVPGQSIAEPEVSFTFGVATDDFLGRRETFGSFAFDGVSARIRDEYPRFGYDLTIGQTFMNDDTLAFYDFYYRFGNGAWRVGVGQFERHWSPSKRTSLILSRNAGGFPAVYISKGDATQSQLPMISAFGPWDGEFFIGVTDDPTQPRNALLMGARLAFQPARGLDIELVKTSQFGGSAQPNDLDAFLKALVGNTNEGTARNVNQVAGIGVSYAPANPAIPVRFFFQGIGEDEAGGLPSCFMFLGGVELETRLFGSHSTITFENVDTRVDETDGGFCGPNTAYNNDMYPYVHKGRSLGAAIDSEGRSTSLYVSHDFPVMRLDWGVSHQTINDASNLNHRLSSVRVSGTSFTIGVSKEAFGGELSAILVHQGFALDRADQDAGLRVGVSFSKSF